jgi:hypothetical protein
MSNSAAMTSTTSKLVVAGWMAMCATGIWQLGEHATTPGTAGAIVSELPAAIAAQLNWKFDTQLLVLAAHPQCPCLPASLSELAAVLRESPDLTLRVLTYQPSTPPEAWNPDARADLLADLPTGCAVLDPDGQLATQLGANTSGHFLLFRTNGNLAFAGGITGSRGHRGDNANRRALLRALQSATTQPVGTPVFGCPLHAPCKCNQ